MVWYYDGSKNYVSSSTTSEREHFCSVSTTRLKFENGARHQVWQSVPGYGTVVSFDNKGYFDSETTTNHLTHLIDVMTDFIC